MTRQHEREIWLSADPKRVFSLLIMPSAIRTWWCASRAIVIPQQGGVWVAAWGSAEDDPDYIFAGVIEEFDPPRCLVLGEQRYLAKSGPLPFEARFRTTFTVEQAKGGSVLKVVQDGFPADAVADEFYVSCEKGGGRRLRTSRSTFTGEAPNPG